MAKAAHTYMHDIQLRIYNGTIQYRKLLDKYYFVKDSPGNVRPCVPTWTEWIDISMIDENGSSQN